jgi:DNA-binding GntR family transcriptional regulator
MAADDRDLVEKISAALEAAIRNGELVPGRRISELQLSSTLNVSRSALREAIRLLEGRRLIERTAFRGVRLVDLTIEDLEQLLLIREVLEGLAARAAAENITPKELASLRAFIKSKDGVQAEASLAFAPIGSDGFHHLIARAGKNRWLTNLLCEDLYGLLRVYRYASVGSAGMTKETLLEHRQIVDAIAKHDTDKAENLMRIHNRNGRINLIQRLKVEHYDESKMSSLRPISRKKK